MTEKIRSIRSEIQTNENSVTVSFNATAVQMTEMSQQKKSLLHSVKTAGNARISVS